MKKVVIFVVILLLVTGCSVKKVKELTDSERFGSEYNISDENPFVYATYDDIEKVLNGTGIIFFANTDTEGSFKAVKLLYSVAVEENIDLIYYYNPKSLKEKNSKKYNKLLKYFDSYIKEEESKDKDLDLPVVVSIKNGKIKGYSNYLSKEEQLSEEKLTQKKKKAIKESYREILNYKKCTNCIS